MENAQYKLINYYYGQVIIGKYLHRPDYPAWEKCAWWQCQCVVPENIHTPPPPLTQQVFFVSTPRPRNSNLTPYFLSNLWFCYPLPLGISIDLPWGWYGYFMELHTRWDILDESKVRWMNERCDFWLCVWKYRIKNVFHLFTMPKPFTVSLHSHIK